MLVPCLLQTLISGRAAAGVGMFQVLEFASQTCGRSTVESSLVQLFQVCPMLARHWAGSMALPFPPQAALKEKAGADTCALSAFFHQLLLHSPATVHLVAPALLRGCECTGLSH